MKILSDGKMPGITTEKKYFAKHGLTQSRIELLQKFREFADRHDAWFVAEFVKIQTEDRASGNFKKPIEWGRNRSADERFFPKVQQYIKQCGEKELFGFDFKQFMVWRLLKFGCQRLRTISGVRSKPRLPVANNSIGYTADAGIVIKAIANKYGIEEMTAKRLDEDFSIGQQFLNNCLQLGMK